MPIRKRGEQQRGKPALAQAIFPEACPYREKDVIDAECWPEAAR
jgi:hypothetical protein